MKNDHSAFDARALEAVRAISPGLLSDNEAVEALARAAWSGIGEPGDRIMGLLCEKIGAAEALRLVLGGAAEQDIAQRLVSQGMDSPADDTLIEAIGEALERWRPRLSANDALAHCERAARIKAQLITPQSALWPDQLSRLGLHRPVALWVRGNPELLATTSSSSVSVVGARASTGYGEHVTMDLVSQLSDRGVVVVSGAAYGIDGMAHRAALANSGATVAVLAGGIDRLYPSGHDALLRKIIQEGLVVTELPCGFAPTKWRFLQRNRLIAALSQATVVVEAGWRSGSLNTAHHALEMAIPVGVVPGPITSPSSAGCHRLLRETPAICVTTAHEIIELLGVSHRGLSESRESHEISEVQAPASGSVHPDALRVLDVLSRTQARSSQDIARAAGLAQRTIDSVLGLLMLESSVIENESGWLKR